MSVVKCGSLSNAALELSLTVSPVCRMISEFESYYEKKLFNRNGKGLSLTEEGEKIYNLLNPIYSELKKVEDIINPRKKKNNAEISIYYDWSNEPIVKILQSYIFNNGNINNFVFYNIDTRADRFISDDTKNSIYIISREFYFRNHKQYRKKHQDLLRIVAGEGYEYKKENENLIICDEQFYNQAINKEITRLKLTNKIKEVIKVGSSEAMREMILDGFGIGIFPQKFSQLKSWAGARCYPLPHKEEISFDSWVYYSLDENIFKDIACLLDKTDITLSQNSYKDN